MKSGSFLDHHLLSHAAVSSGGRVQARLPDVHQGCDARTISSEILNGHAWFELLQCQLLFLSG